MGKFIRSDESNLVGCSPDGLIGDKGLTEIKCPFFTKNHVKHLVEGAPIDYQQQMQFQMFVWKREWNDFVSFDPRVEPPYDLYIKRYMR
ncbi:YqaJ viral recombinase family protein, partial [Candidatus Woesearchaeota archaeon]|nr:YqaJ viral recombinase family protein [Candidatus Woesearchaeota archaeon]